MKWTTLQPNEHGDWLNKRNDQFGSFISLGEKGDKDNKQTVFVPYYSRGLETARDAWVYNSSRDSLTTNMRRTIKVFNSEIDRYAVALNSNKNINIGSFVTSDKKQISWSSSLTPLVERQIKTKFDFKKIRVGLYRPFYKQFVYFDQTMNHRTGQWFNIFPTPEHENLVICVSGLGGEKENTTIITDLIPDLNCLDAGTQCFPLYYYELIPDHKKTLFDTDQDNLARRSGLTDFILEQSRALYGPKTTKEDVFYYVYGLLHSPDYRRTFAADLKKMLPRLPLVEKPADFWSFNKAGHALADLHLNYEEAPPPSDVKVIGADSGKFQVEKMRFLDKADKSVIEYNAWIKITTFP